MVILETFLGEIHINVDADKAPITAKILLIMLQMASLKVLFFTALFQTS